ncbi:hypothetical protein OPQ81_008559 [Rhizoctonia solani]|nr:hypothetical protein OPQ81_008559 [Rhizoctonia solani]
MDSTNPTRPSKPPPNAYEGPDDNDPLTEKELEILLAIPRAAENTPNDTAFRIPLGADPLYGMDRCNLERGTVHYCSLGGNLEYSIIRNTD